LKKNLAGLIPKEIQLVVSTCNSNVVSRSLSSIVHQRWATFFSNSVEYLYIDNGEIGLEMNAYLSMLNNKKVMDFY
jgi:hypothetical protein